ncbi:hypothetical protein ACWD4G_11970 [Streptomyces sp. NPDC002643]
MSIVVPGLTWQYDLDDERRLVGARVWDEDGSSARLHSDGAVTEVGPLWAVLEDAYRAYRNAGQPAPDRYRVTIGDDQEQRVWLDNPGGSSWVLRACCR